MEDLPTRSTLSNMLIT